MNPAPVSSSSTGMFSVLTSMVTNSPRLTVRSGPKQGFPATFSPEKIPVFFIHSAENRQSLPTVSVYWVASAGLRMVMVTVASREVFPEASVAVKVKESMPTLFFLGV